MLANLIDVERRRGQEVCGSSVGTECGAAWPLFWVLPGFPGVSSLAHIQVCTQLDRLSRAIKRIRVSVAVKSAMKCPFKCALSTLPRTLNRTLRRHPYSDTLNRTAYAIPSHCWS